jgi:tRNA 2-thiouridine synthesizing protein A
MARLLDARGLRCPWPALRLARTMRETSPGEAIEMVIDDPKAEQEVSGLCRANGWSVLAIEKDGERVFTIAR